MRVLGVPAAALCAAPLILAAPAVAEPLAPVPIPEGPADTTAAMLVDDPAIVDAHPTRPQSWSRVPDERMVRLHFTTGTPECYGVTAAVQESPDAVIVDLRTGTLPQAVGRACIAIGLFADLDVPLQEPLGTRRVLSAT